MPRRSLIASLSAAASVAASAGSASAFHVSPPPHPAARPAPAAATSFRPARPSSSSGVSLESHGVRHSPLEDSPWETDPSYFDQLREAAKDPETFEAFVAANGNGKRPGTAARARAAPDGGIRGDGGGDEAPPKPKKKGGYQRIEEWDEEIKKKQDGSGMTWEEKVQFDGLRQGNQVRQNDILMHHLNSF